jgi:hypothetical protein
MALLDLPPELMDDMTAFLTVHECAKFATCCATFRAHVDAPAFVAERGRMLGAPEGLSLEQLAVMEATSAFDNHVYHKGVWADEQDAAILVSGVGELSPELGLLAAVLRRHPNASVELHSHISPGNQPHTYRVTQLRGEAVKRELELRGVSSTAVSTVSWGDRIALRSRWRTLDAARERGSVSNHVFGPFMSRSKPHALPMCCTGTVFFVVVGDRCFPPRPSVYDAEPVPSAAPSLFGMEPGSLAMMALSIHNAGLGLGGGDDDDDVLGSDSDQFEVVVEGEEAAEPLL